MANPLPMIQNREERFADIQSRLGGATLADDHDQILHEITTDINSVAPKALKQLYDSYKTCFTLIGDAVKGIQKNEIEIASLEEDEKSEKSNLSTTETLVKVTRYGVGAVTAVSGAGFVGLGGTVLAAGAGAAATIAVAPVAIATAACAGAAIPGILIYRKLSSSETSIRSTLNNNDPVVGDSAKGNKTVIEAKEAEISKYAASVKKWYKSTDLKKNANAIKIALKAVYQAALEAERLKMDVDELYNATQAHIMTLRSRIHTYQTSSQNYGALTSAVDAITGPIMAIPGAIKRLFDKEEGDKSEPEAKRQNTGEADKKKQ